jgi:hypothetical protein
LDNDLKPTKKCLFKKTENRKVKQVLFGELVPVGGGRTEGKGVGG